MRDAVPIADRELAVATLTSAFTADPVMRWMWPEPAAYLEHFPRLVVAFGGKAFGEDTAWGLPDASAVALWLAPGVEADGDAVADVLVGSVAAEKHDDLLSVLDQMDAAHLTYEHWYLPWFGVAVASQGAGLGSRLMTACLAKVDADHLPAYLETPNPRNIPFYERHGFVVTGRATAGDCPPVTFMLRPAQGLPPAR
jgi:GNAT superfamily N-acetyltransferase